MQVIYLCSVRKSYTKKMEGKALKSMIMCVVILGLVVEQIQVEGTTCCPSTSARDCYKACSVGSPQQTCAYLCGCQIVFGTCLPGYEKFNIFPNSEEATVGDYCKLGCTSSVCDTLNTDVGIKEVKDAAEHCNNACSRFCAKNVEIAMVTA